MKLATETHCPNVVTTNVQFLNHFSNTSSRCRKLHISKSIIILMKCKCYHINFLKPCLLVIQELVNNYNASILMCSVTQPYFNQVVEDFQVKDIIENPIAIIQY